MSLDWQLSKGFRRTVLEHLAVDISYGATASYGTLARLSGSPNAVRAVGTTCATNPIPVVVPCHRVVRADGTMGQYRGGTCRKTHPAGSRRGAMTSARTRAQPGDATRGEIIAVTGRGAWRGNRGRLHEARDAPQWASNHYTQLFFLDEAVALAAGHRPCAECRRDDYNASRQAWSQTNGVVHLAAGACR